jgi:hypothetical protein
MAKLVGASALVTAASEGCAVVTGVALLSVPRCWRELQGKKGRRGRIDPAAEGHRPGQRRIHNRRARLGASDALGHRRRGGVPRLRRGGLKNRRAAEGQLRNPKFLRSLFQ